MSRFTRLLKESIILSLLGVSGCASLPPTLVTSSSPLPPGVRGTIPAYGSDCHFYLFGLSIFPLTGNLNTQTALDEAKESANVDVLTDITVDYGGAYYILFSNSCVRIRGKGVERRALEASLRAMNPSTYSSRPFATPTPWPSPLATPTPRVVEKSL